MLTAAGDKKINVIKEIRTVTSLGLKEAKDLVDGAPKPVKEGVDKATAEEIHKLFCEVVIAPYYDGNALEILKGKKNRIILIQNEIKMPQSNVRTCLNGILVQEKDTITDSSDKLTSRTDLKPSESEIEDLLFASKICKHTKSNTIVFTKNNQLLASGTGQTSRVDALRQAIEKATSFGFDLNGAVMASDAFFPFPDCVEIAKNAGITKKRQQLLYRLIVYFNPENILELGTSLGIATTTSATPKSKFFLISLSCLIPKYSQLKVLRQTTSSILNCILKKHHLN